jgi:hypothetical protein
MPLGLRESPPDTTIQFLHMSNKILVTLDIQNGVWHVNEVRHLNLLTFALGDESLGGSEGAGAEACGASQVDLRRPSGLPRRTRTRGVVLGLRRLDLTTALIVVLLAPPVHHPSAREVASWPSWASSPTPPCRPAPVRRCKRWTRAPDAGPRPPPPPVLAVVLRDGCLPSFSVTCDQHINKTELV